jgi:hypothetical protein
MKFTTEAQRHREIRIEEGVFGVSAVPKSIQMEK